MQLKGLFVGTLQRIVVGREPAPAPETLAGIRRLQFSCTAGLNMQTERNWVVARRTEGCHGRMSGSPSACRIRQEGKRNVALGPSVSARCSLAMCVVRTESQL